jgi:hypothetical protein
MRRGSNLEHKNQFMLRAIERPHAAIGLVPNAQVLQFGENLFARTQELAHVTPVHEYKRDGASRHIVRPNDAGIVLDDDAV